MLNRRFLVAAAAFLPLAADANAHKGRRRKPRTCPPPEPLGFCQRDICAAGDPPCGNRGVCHCLGAGAGTGRCVRKAIGQESPCDGLACPDGHVCLETCAHPGEKRCYLQLC